MSIISLLYWVHRGNQIFIKVSWWIEILDCSRNISFFILKFCWFIRWHQKSKRIYVCFQIQVKRVRANIQNALKVCISFEHFWMNTIKSVLNGCMWWFMGLWNLHKWTVGKLRIQSEMCTSNGICALENSFGFVFW